MLHFILLIQIRKCTISKEIQWNPLKKKSSEIQTPNSFFLASDVLQRPTTAPCILGTNQRTLFTNQHFIKRGKWKAAQLT